MNVGIRKNTKFTLGIAQIQQIKDQKKELESIDESKELVI